mgnify:CR=1 FL=1
MTQDKVYYFAYGSNMSQERLQERIPEAKPQGKAKLNNYQLVINKAGSDGSGKANLKADSGSEVWGVVYELDSSSLPELDTYEPGYDRELVEVKTEAGTSLIAVTYRSEKTGEDKPYEWYKQHLLAGAYEHSLPAEYVKKLEAIETKSEE